MDQHITRPRPTAIFMSVPQHNRIYVRIHRWFRFGIYDFSKENFMLLFIKISSLYESYLLTKMLCYFRDRGYSLGVSKHCVYPVSKRWKYRNTTKQEYIGKKQKLRQFSGCPIICRSVCLSVKSMSSVMKSMFLNVLFLPLSVKFTVLFFITV